MKIDPKMLDPEIQAVLHKMNKEKNLKMFLRYQAIYLRLKGRKLQEIADIIRASRKTVINYIAAYRKDGLDGLIPVKQTGQPKFLTDEQENKLIKVIIDMVPAEVGFAATYNWTAKIIKEYIQKTFNVEYSISGVTALLHRLGFSYTRPNYTLKKADPKKQEQFVTNFTKRAF
jgi:transposase